MKARRLPEPRAKIGASMFARSRTIALILLAVFSVLSAACTPKKEVQPPPPATFVGRSACVPCHEQEDKLFAGSHHDLAMQPANESTVLGDFNNRNLKHGGVTSTFFRKDGSYLIRTDGPDGKLADYPVRYVFGVTPLEQYLVEFPRGRYQVPSLAWDSRPKKSGGQRWIHLYPNERIPPNDELHWTKPAQNWNFMCAECHSTNLKKNYDPATHTYNTTYSEIDVSCEACHGPASAHVLWEKEFQKNPGLEKIANRGLDVVFTSPFDTEWLFDEGENTARRKEPRTSIDMGMEMCARCHARRSLISEDYRYGSPISNSHRIVLPVEPEFFIDGQVRDEDYNYASFLQSKMHASGVVCGDCHDPHSAKLLAGGNALCNRCHIADKYDSSKHHFHKSEGSGALCKNCHISPRDYMVVDPRHDHSFRIPRPDLSVKLGVSNACTMCHKDKSDLWARGYTRKWYGTKTEENVHFGEIFREIQRSVPGSLERLLALLKDPKVPAIVRAAGYHYLEPGYQDAARPAIVLGLADASPLVRIAAVGILSRMEPRERWEMARTLLKDNIRGVRVAVASELAPMLMHLPPGDDRTLLEKCVEEAKDSYRSNADRASGHMNLGNLYMAMGNLEGAEASYKEGIQTEPEFVGTYFNLADLYREKGRDDLAEPLLHEIISLSPRLASAYHALGLLKIRQKKVLEALSHLEKAARLQPEDPRNAYVYAVALESVGRRKEAVRELQRALRDHPYDSAILAALAEYGNRKH